MDTTIRYTDVVNGAFAGEKICQIARYDGRGITQGNICFGLFP